jgi:hypothetical protein
MNIRNDHDAFDPLDQAEWLAQERARVAARDGASLAGDPMAARYARIAGALREPLDVALPPDFASQLARRVQAGASSLAEGVFERALTRGLLGVFGLAAAVVAGMYGAQWLPPILEFLKLDSAVAVNWALALGACVGASWLTDQLRKHWRATHAA